MSSQCFIKGSDNISGILFNIFFLLISIRWKISSPAIWRTSHQRRWVNKFKNLKFQTIHVLCSTVGPEDGYKSYQCRTKHRLTGETRLSATKGRLVITGMLIHCFVKIMMEF